MKRLIVLFFGLFLTNASFSQGLNNLFMFGYNRNGNVPSNMDLLSGAPVLSTALRGMNMQTSHANITDSLGNLLFYTNGIYIADASNDTMINGSGLNPSFITDGYQNYGLRIPQSDLIIPKPGSSSIYYLFHCTWDDGFTNFSAAKYFYVTTIDMNGNNGLGEVIDKNNVILSDTLTGGTITACKHANGRDWWVVLPEYPHPSYYVFLVTPDTIMLSSKQTIGVRDISWGQMCFSKDGTKFGSYDATTDIEIFDFDRCSGTLSNPVFVPVNDGQDGFGCSFSPDAGKFYASSNKTLYQIDLTSTNIPSTLDTVAQWDSTFCSNGLPTGFLMQELGSDDKIYVVTDWFTDKLSVIQSPDNLGISCNAVQHAITLPGLNDATIPNHPNYFLGPVTGSVCDSLSTGIKEQEKTPMQIKLSPNPANGEVYVLYDFGYQHNGTVELLDLQGRVLYRQNLYWSGKQLQLHTANYTNGLYEVVVKDDIGRKTSAKLVVQH